MKVSTIAIIVVVVVIVAGVAAFEIHRPHSQVTTPSVIVEGSAKAPGHLDPAVTFSTAGWEIANQIYQGLVAPNGTSEDTYVGVLAVNWSVSPNGMHYTFYLRHNVTFSNGYPYNAYVQWYSMYRTIIMNQAPSFILSQNFNYSNGVNFTVTPQELNTFNFTDPNASELQVMEYPYQSFQVINKYEIRLNLGYGYNGDVPFNSLLATLTTPMAAAVDPAYVDAHGGVQYGTINSYMTTHALGTGPYVLEKYVPGQTAVLEANPHYWAYNISSSQWNYAIHPPYVKEIVIDYQPVSTSISAAKAGQLQVIDDPSTQYYSTLKSLPGFNVTVLPVQFGSSEGAYWVYMDPYGYKPFYNLDVRAAVVYGINYTGIISTVFHGLATQWIGPIPAGFPYYSNVTSGLQNYTYNPTLAAEYLAKAGYEAKFPNGTVVNKNNPLPPVNFTFNSGSTSQSEEAQIIISDLNAIGFDITSDGVTHSAWESIIYSTDNSTSGLTYPMGIGYYTEDYTASSDYATAIMDESYVEAPWFNETMFNLTVNGTSTYNTQYIVQNYTELVHAVYHQYWFAWLNIPYMLAVHVDTLTGFIENPAGSAAGYFMFWSDVHYTSQTSYLPPDVQMMAATREGEGI